METIKDRLMAFKDSLGMKTKTFEVKCGLSNGYLANMRKGIGVEKLSNVLTAFPQLNREWLMYGEGNMLNDAPPHHNLQPHNHLKNRPTS